MRSWIQVTVYGCAAAFACAACQRPPQEDLFKKAETLYLDRRYDEAIDVFKQFLVDHPDNAGAHFYLGTCYFASKENRWLGIAQGELETAIALFERQGKVNPVPRFSDAKYFELIAHINLAKIYLGLVISVLESPPSEFPRIDRREAIALLLDKCDEQYRIVEQIDPDHPDAKWLIGNINDLRRTLVVPRRPPRPPEKAD